MNHVSTDSQNPTSSGMQLPQHEGLYLPLPSCKLPGVAAAQRWWQLASAHMRGKSTLSAGTSQERSWLLLQIRPASFMKKTDKTIQHVHHLKKKTPRSCRALAHGDQPYIHSEIKLLTSAVDTKDFMPALTAFPEWTTEGTSWVQFTCRMSSSQWCTTLL